MGRIVPCVVIVTTSAYSKGEGVTPAATKPLMWAMSDKRRSLKKHKGININSPRCLNVLDDASAKGKGKFVGVLFSIKMDCCPKKLLKLFKTEIMHKKILGKMIIDLDDLVCEDLMVANWPDSAMDSS